MPGMEEGQRRKKVLMVVLVVLAALFVPVALLLGGGWQMWREHRATQHYQAEHAAALQAALERAADVVMPAPSLSGEEVELEVAMENFETELQRVIRLARGLGGSAASWNDGATVRIIANVPVSAAGLFRDALEGGVYDLRAEGEGPTMTVVTIVLRPAD